MELYLDDGRNIEEKRNRDLSVTGVKKCSKRKWR